MPYNSTFGPKTAKRFRFFGVKGKYIPLLVSFGPFFDFSSGPLRRSFATASHLFAGCSHVLHKLFELLVRIVCVEHAMVICEVGSELCTNYTVPLVVYIRF